MNKYSDSCSSYTIERFLDDPIFQDWVLRPDQSNVGFWREWISQNPGALHKINEARKILIEINTPAYRLEDRDIQGIWKGIRQNIQPKALSVVKYSLLRRLRFASVAACFVLISGLALYFFLTKNPPQTTYRTGFGETLSIVLPDSSTVILNANSTLSFSQDWDFNSIREVWVEGEAFFDVQHRDTHQPFKVYPALGIEVEVLGTKFNVYQRKNQTKVLLSEGNVTMSFTDSPQKSKILMNPGDLVEYDREKIQKKRVNPVTYVSWTKKVLQLESTTLDEMVRMAEENYGLKIQIGPQVQLEQSASGSMPLIDGASFMKLTSRIFNIQIEYRDSIYYMQ